MVNKHIINKVDITSMNVSIYHYLIILAIILQSVAYIPFIIDIYKTKITNNNENGKNKKYKLQTSKLTKQ